MPAEPQPAAGQITGGEERQAANMIDVAMREQDVSFDGGLLLEQGLAQGPHPRPAVEDEQIVTATHFNTGSVAAVTGDAGVGTGDAATNTPEAHRDVGHEILTRPGWMLASPPADSAHRAGSNRGRS